LAFLDNDHPFRHQAGNSLANAGLSFRFPSACQYVNPPSLIGAIAIHNLASTAGSRHVWRVRKKIISSTPDVMGGTPVFAGTRVPVQTLIDYIEGGESIDDFVEGFPTVKRAQVIEFLEEAKKRVLAEAA